MQPSESIRVYVTWPDGHVEVSTIITNDFRGYSMEPTDENIEKVLRKGLDPHPGKPNFEDITWRRGSLADPLPDRTFRNAWEDTGKIEINMEKARGIHKDFLRRQRAPKLTELDIQFQKAIETEDKQEQKRIAARKTDLRNITDHPEIKNATTPDELKQAGLRVLEG